MEGLSIHSYLSLIGHYGTGKTMLAAEVVKIWLGRFLETYRVVDAFVLTYDSHWGYNYALLIQELRDKYFPDENQLQVSLWHEFMKKFAQVHQMDLTQEERDLFVERIVGGKIVLYSTQIIFYLNLFLYNFRGIFSAWPYLEEIFHRGMQTFF